MKSSQRPGSTDERPGTARMRRWWTEEKPSVRLFEVASGLALAVALVWTGWFASPGQAATWSTVVVTISIVAAVTFARWKSGTPRSR